MTAIKKNIDSNDVKQLTDSVVSLSKDIKLMTKKLSVLVTTLCEHGAAINELYAVQEIILRQLNVDVIEPEFTEAPRNKSQKLN
jgi:hypothetical protein